MRLLDRVWDRRSARPTAGHAHRRGNHLENASEPAAATTSYVEHARGEFIGVFADLARGKRNWQVMAFTVTTLLVVVTLAYLRLAASSRLVPYVVQVDRLGQVVAAGTAEPMRAPDDRLVASQLALFLRSVRTVLPVAAAAAQAEMIRRGYTFATPEAAGFLNYHFARPENDPRVLGSRLARQVDVTSVLRMPKSDVWTLRWTETESPLQAGVSARTTAWEAYVTVKLVPPATIEGIQDNPLGLYVTSITWTPIATRSGGSVAPSGSSMSSQTGGVP